MIKTIIIDWGNVVRFYHLQDFLNKMSNYFSVSKSLFQEAELKNRLKHDLGEISTKEFVANLSAEINRTFTVEEYYDLIDKFKCETPNDEIIDLIKHLRKYYKIFLLSNNSKPVYDSIMKNNLRKLFDKILFSFQVGIKKPDKQFFNLLLEGTPFSFRDCLLIDDREDTCIAAESYGMRSIIFKSNDQLKKELALLKIRMD